MNKPNLDAFLLGTAEDQQHRACEEFLSNPETIVDFQTEVEVEGDSLISALRVSGTSTCDTPQLDSLVEQVERLVPRHSITTDELKRFLDPPDFNDDLGKINRFRIIEFLASGGMGLVFRAVDPNLDREVCLKLLRPDLEFNSEAKSRFERESREVARMGSERIVSVLEVGRQHGLPFFVMPMLEGMSLKSMLDKQGKLVPKRAMQITRQLAQGLQYAHDRNLLHRDIKPDNLWLTTTGDVIVLDFGLVRSTNDSNEIEPPITRQGTVIGTPSYMSPEQVTGKELDQRSDLFSVGVVLVEMLTGESPFKKANLFSTMMSVAGDEIKIDQLDLMADVPAGLSGLAQRLLHKNPDDRIESASELLQVLDQLEGSPNSSLNSTSPSKTRGTKWLTYIAAGIIGVLLSGIALAAWVANDKGTLVVSANDPDVEIKIAGEQVSVHDPVSNRSYKIRIGDTPLPSGVYQLESESLDGGLVFSSRTIAIRRGKETVVTVELVEPNSAAKTASNANLSFVAEQAWRDRTRAPEAYEPANRTSLINRVRELPSLSLADIGFDTSPALSDQATVHQPKNLNGIKAWSVERLTGRELDYYPNCDRTLFVGTEKSTSKPTGFVRILNSSGDLCAALPVPGQVSRIRWCDHAQDLIAVSSWVREFDKDASNFYAITIWQITPTGARLLRSIRASDRSFNWDSGYRIICLIDDKLSAFRIDNDSIWSMPEASKGEFLYDGAISPDGRFVATYSLPSKKSQISIWDLKSAEFLMAIPSGTSFRWGSDSKHIAVDVRRLFGRQNDDTNSLEIWNVESQQMTKSFTKQESGKSNINPGLTTLAVKQKSGDVVLTDTSTRREKSITAPDEFIAKTSGNFSIRWKSENQLEFFQRPNEWSTVWAREQSNLSGQFGPVVKTPKIDQANANRFEFADFRMTSADELTLIGSSQIPGNNTTTAVSINLAKNSITRNVSFTNLAWNKQRNRYYGNMIHPGAERHMLSPSGKFVLAWADSEPSNYPRNSKNLRVIELGNPDRVLPIMDLEWVSETAWSNDESLLIVRGTTWEQGRSRFGCKVIDLNNWAVREVKGLPTDLAANFLAWNGGFVCRISNVLRGSPLGQKWKLGYLGSGQESVFRTFDEEFSHVSFKKFDGEDIVFSGRRSDESEQQSTSLPNRFFRLSKDFQIAEVAEFSADDQDSWNDSYSFDGRFRVHQHLENSQERARVRASTISIFAAGNEVEKGLSSDEVIWKGRVREFQWHPRSNSAIWRSIDDRHWRVFAPGKMLEPRIIVKTRIPKPFRNGWLFMTGQEIRQVGFDGQVNGSLSIARNDSGDLEYPVWVFPDGAVIGNANSLHSLYETEQEFQVKALSEFQKRFPNATSPGSKTILMRIQATQVK